MVWFFVLLFAFMALFGWALWLAGKDPRVKARAEADEQKPASKHEQVHQEALRQRARAIKAARVMSASGLVEQAQDEPFDAAASEARVKAAVQATVQTDAWRSQASQPAYAHPAQPPKTQVKKGFSRYESPPQVLMNGLEVKTTGGAQVTFPLTLTASVIVEIDEVFAALNRQATQARSDGDMDLAVDLLRQAKQRQGDDYESTRLALYLQHAGCFDEAMAEFDWLLAHVDAQVEASFQHRTPTTRKQFKALMRYKIHDKARLACKREGRSDLEEHHQQLARAYDRERLSLQAAAKRSEHEARKRREAKFEKARASLRGDQ